MYDAIIVGARCAGAPTAMLLARRGYRVLMVDRDSFPSDIMSTHLVLNSGVAKLASWGLLEQVIATGCPRIDRIALDLGPIVISGTPTAVDGISQAYCPRRKLLDKILVDAAVAAGAELREGFTVHELTRDGERVSGVRGRSGGGASIDEEARIVVGADGVHSVVARLVDAPQYNAVPARSCGYYSYFSGIPVEAATIYQRGSRVLFSFPTNGGLTCLAAEWPSAEFHEVRQDIEGHFHRALQLVPALAERAAAAKREERWNGTGDIPNFFRRPFGPGWALVGDAGYHKDPVTGRGISDCFRDAELLAEAIDNGLSGRRPIEAALADYERRRNEESMPVYEITLQQVAFEPPPPETIALLAAVARSPEETSRFLGMVSGGTSIAEFMAPENLQRIMAAGRPAAD
jgi:flavin-dependent dehydrogenase